MAEIGIIGAGSWGIALAWLLHNNGHNVQVWSILEDEIQMLKTKHEHVDKLPGVKLPEDMKFTTDLKEAVEGKEILVLAVPSPFTRSTAKSMKEYVKEGQIIVNVAKGIEEATLMTLTQIIEQETSPDLIGMEVGASLKNVIALAAGIADGLGCGDNTKAALITRGIAEISRLGIAMGGKAETFAGLTGIGDLIVTCASVHSRNRRAGVLIGKGYTMQQAMEEVKMVVEGVYSTKAAVALGKKYNISLPIIEQVNEVLFNGKKATEALKDLMIRDKTIEHSSLAWE